MTADGDDIVCIMTMTGTYRAKPELARVLGGLLPEVEPTGQHVEVLHIHRFRISDGLVVDHRAVRDDLSMMKQLGFINTLTR